LLHDLRGTIARIERSATAPARADTAVATGLPAIDQALPAGGLIRGAVHEAMGAGPDTVHAAAATLFVAGILARLDGPIVWVLRHADLFAPGLASAGLSPDRVIFVEAGKDVLAAVEEGLRHPSLVSVVGEIEGRLTLVASRRLQLAAEQTGILAMLLRRSQTFDDPALREPTAAVTRWRVTMLPGPTALPHDPAISGIGRARWRLDLLRNRGGEAGSWVVEGTDATGHLGLVAEVRDRPAAEDRRRSA
jgi:protein ImuA